MLMEHVCQDHQNPNKDLQVSSWCLRSKFAHLPTVQKAWENKSFSQRVSLNFADDSVYMRTRAHLNEYLLNDVGKVYQGSYKTPIGRDWAFGQFEAAVLPAAFFLLDKSQLRPTERGNPIKVSRAISAMGKRHALKKLKQVTKNTGYFFLDIAHLSCNINTVFSSF